MIAPRHLAVTFAMLMGLLVFVPWAAPTLSFRSLDQLSVDLAFNLAMPALFLSGTQFGPDAVFTYGPWGFLASNLVPFRLFPDVIAFHIALAIFPLVYMSRLLHLPIEHIVWKVGLLLGAIVLWTFWSTMLDQGLWLLPGMLVATGVLSVAHQRARNIDIGLLAVLSAISAWAGLVKFNVFVSGAIVHLAVLAFNLPRRQFPLFPVVWTSVTLLAWIAARQSLDNLPLWIVRSLDLSAGYPDAMAKGFTAPYGLATLAVFYAAMLCVVSTAGIVAINGVRPWDAGLLLFGIFAANAFMALQHAIGGNQLEQAVGELLGISWLLALVTARSAAGTRARRVAGLLLGTCSLCLGASLMDTGFLVYGPQQLPVRLSSNVVALGRMLRGDISAQRAFWGRFMSDIARSVPLPPDLHGTADVYPQDTAVVIADPALRYTPRPAYLALNAHTVGLADANAASLRDRRPDILLFQILDPSRVVNDRLQATEDGASWPVILSYYRPDRFAGDFLVLRRRTTPLPVTRTLAAANDLELGQTLALPAASQLWMEVSVKRSLLGSLVRMLYKSPQLRLSLTSATGHVTHQLVPELAKAGFLASPLVTTTFDFTGLFRPDLSVQDWVSDVSIDTEPGLRWFWEAPVHVRLYRLAVAPDLEPMAEIDAALRLLTLKQRVGTCLFPPSLQNAPGEPHFVLLLHAPCHTSIAVPANSSGARLRFGLRYLPDPNQPVRTDGAGLNFSAVSNTGGQVTTASRYLDPVKHPADRGPQDEVLHWAPDSASEVHIDIDPGPRKDPIFDHTYVSSVEFLMPEKKAIQNDKP